MALLYNHWGVDLAHASATPAGALRRHVSGGLAWHYGWRVHRDARGPGSDPGNLYLQLEYQGTWDFSPGISGCTDSEQHLHPGGRSYTPLHYQETGQARDHRDDVDLSFDPATGRVHGIAQTHAVDQPLDPGIQDPMSVQIELMRELRAGLAPTQFKLFDKDEAKEYFYTRERSEVLNTPLGSLDTVVYRSDRPGSDRVTRLWLAPKFNYLPLQAARSRNGSVDLSMRISA